MAIVLSEASPVVTVSAPVSEAALRSATRPVTVSAAEPESVSAALLPQPLPSAAALIVTVSFAPLAVIEVAPDPVVMAKLLSVASPVVRLSAPVRAPTLRLPTRPVTTSAAEPDRVSVAFSARAAALTVTTSLLPLALIEVAPEPVVMAIVVVGSIPRGHVERPGQGAGIEIADQPGDGLSRRACQRQHRVLRQCGALTVTVSLLKLSADRGGPEPVVMAIVLSVASPVVTESAPVSEAALILPTSPLTVFGGRACQGQRRVVGQRGRIDQSRYRWRHSH